MSNSTSTKVFASYSSADRSLVIPIVGLLRANRSFVFQDIDSKSLGTGLELRIFSVKNYFDEPRRLDKLLVFRIFQHIKFPLIPPAPGRSGINGGADSIFCK